MVKDLSKNDSLKEDLQIDTLCISCGGIGTVVRVRSHCVEGHGLRPAAWLAPLQAYPKLPHKLLSIRRLKSTFLVIYVMVHMRKKVSEYKFSS